MVQKSLKFRVFSLLFHCYYCFIASLFKKCSLFYVHCSLFTSYCLLHTAPFIVHCSLLTADCGLPTVLLHFYQFLLISVFYFNFSFIVLCNNTLYVVLFNLYLIYILLYPFQNLNSYLLIVRLIR